MENKKAIIGIALLGATALIYKKSKKSQSTSLSGVSDEDDDKKAKRYYEEVMEDLKMFYKYEHLLEDDEEDIEEEISNKKELEKVLDFKENNTDGLNNYGLSIDKNISYDFLLGYGGPNIFIRIYEGKAEYHYYWGSTKLIRDIDEDLADYLREYFDLDFSE